MSRRVGVLMSIVAAAVTVCSAGIAREPPDFAAIAQAGPRPEECGGGTRTPPSRWERAREPHLDQFCAALAGGYTSLRVAPRAALDDAAVAERVEPGRPATLLLAARAEVRLRAFGEAWTRFAALRRTSPRSFDAPDVLHDFAIAALRTHHADTALDAYRLLVSRLGLLDDARATLRVYIEAGVLAMSLGPGHLAEALGYLTEGARSSPLADGSDYLWGATALARSRAGAPSEATAAAERASGPWQLEAERSHPGGAAPDLPSGELDAMIAELAERRDRDLSLVRWKSYLDGDIGKGPNAAHARGERDALLRGRPRAP